MATMVSTTRLIVMLYVHCWPLSHTAVSSMHTLHDNIVFHV